MASRLASRLAAILLLCAATSVAGQETEDTPIDLGIEEQVDVNFVLVDFMVLDRDDRQVPDLTIDCLRSLSSEVSTLPGVKVAICENGTGPESVEQLRAAIEEELKKIDK